MSVRRPAIPHQSRAKRLFDVVAATALATLFSPLIVAVAILVRAKLGRPVIFSQVRPGLGGRPFTIYKFRTMLDTTDANGQLLPSVDRTPPFGQRLRALSLDELPELWNVIRGDMSLVGPRPLMTAYLPRYSAVQSRRHDVRPGITGLAQVSGRNAISWEQKFELDVRYVATHNLRMDLDILRRTVGVVLSRGGVRYAESIDMPEFLGSEAPASGAGAAR
jgi:lipopolysaccharide/colanic/teichoic acid biosynthesis glycosyltransferase